MPLIFNNACISKGRVLLSYMDKRLILRPFQHSLFHLLNIILFMTFSMEPYRSYFLLLFCAHSYIVLQYITPILYSFQSLYNVQYSSIFKIIAFNFNWSILFPPSPLVFFYVFVSMSFILSFFWYVVIL